MIFRVGMLRLLSSRVLPAWIRDPTTLRSLSTSKPRNDYLENLFDLTGSVAFVTGGSGGIGWQTCLSLAKAGADVMVTDYSEDTHKRCEPLVSEIRDLGRQATSCVCDVRYPESVNRAVNKCKAKLGLLDILVANAGILGGMQIPQELDDDNWKNVFATNVDGVFHCCRAAYPIMKNNGRGKVIIMSSVSSLTGYHTQAAFSSSKGAVIPFAKSLAVAWAPSNIQVNCVLPGAVNTEFNAALLGDENQRKNMVDSIPAGRLAEPKDIIGAILFFASRASDYCTGSQLVVDGGISSNTFGSSF